MTPRIAIDISTIDHLSLNQGQYRYALDLLSGFSQLDIAAEILVFGSRSQPADPFSEIFNAPGTSGKWKYCVLPNRTFPGSWIWDDCRRCWQIMRHHINVWHAIHTVVPPFPLCPIVVTEHDLMFDLFPEYEAARSSRPYQRYRARVMNHAAQVICISETTRTDLLRLYPMPREKTSVVHHGTSLSDGDLCASPEWAVAHSLEQESSSWIASPYNLEPRKNLRVLVKMIASLKAEFPSIRLVLFGKAGWSEQRELEFRSLVQNLGVEKHVVFAGFLSDSELKWVYARCTLFVFPSFYEGFGLPLIEAMAQGSCVVCKGESAMAEVVGGAGYLVDTKDSDVLTHACAELLRSPLTRRALSERAVARAKTFSVSAMTMATLRVYENVLQRQLLR